MTSQSVILIVDDEQRGREALEGVLTGQGYELFFAGSGEEALSQAAALSPDVILLDVMMPDIDGFSVCRRIRSDERLAGIPVIMITALDDQDSRLQGIDAGADDFISKPFNRVELRARVRTITRLNRYRRLMVERDQFDWMLEQANEGYVLLKENDGIIFANIKARLYLDIIGDMSELPEEKFLELARRKYRCEPEEAWWGWPTPASLRYAGKRYLVRRETSESSACWLQISLFERSPGAETHWLVCLKEITGEITARRNSWFFERMLSMRLQVSLSQLKTPIKAIAEKGHYLSPAESVEFAGAAMLLIDNISREMTDITRFREAAILARPGSGFPVGQLPMLLDQLRRDMELSLPIEMSINEELMKTRLVLSRGSLELCFWEILENARKFHPQRAPVIDISANPIGEIVRIQVRDNGRTLTPRQIARVWTPYYQGEQTVEEGGTGIGLSVVASIIWQIGGNCRLRNREKEPGVIVELDILRESAGEQ